MLSVILINNTTCRFRSPYLIDPQCLFATLMRLRDFREKLENIVERKVERNDCPCVAPLNAIC